MKVTLRLSDEELKEAVREWLLRNRPQYDEAAKGWEIDFEIRHEERGDQRCPDTYHFITCVATREAP
jgi:hypothetical protein